MSEAKIILGISAYYHDSAACIVQGETIIAAAQEERFTRVKHDSGFPKHAIQYCLDESGFSLKDLDAVVFYDKPFLKFERLLETYYAYSPKGVLSFIRAMPAWVKEKLFMKSNLRKSLNEIQDFPKNVKLLFAEHHLSHAASAYYPSPYSEAAILTIDGVGEWATSSICHGEGKTIKILKEVRFPHSVGLLYSAFTYFLGFKVNSGEYKLMGLAPYGNPNSERFKSFVETIKTKLIRINEDGSFVLNQRQFNYATGLRMVRDDKWKSLFGISRREPDEKIEQAHMDLALAIQSVTEEMVLSLAKEAARLTGSSNLCLAGGVALNCVANGRLESTGLFKNIWIQPAAGDAGGALGSALAINHIFYDQDRSETTEDRMNGAYLGPEYYDGDILRVSKSYQSPLNELNLIVSFTMKCPNSLQMATLSGGSRSNGVWTSRAWTSQHTCRSEKSGNAKEAKSQDQIPRELSPFCSFCLKGRCA